MTCQVRWGVVSSTAPRPPGSLPPGVCPQLCSHLTLEWGCRLPVAAGEVTLLYLGFGYEGLWLCLVCSLSWILLLGPLALGKPAAMLWGHGGSGAETRGDPWPTARERLREISLRPQWTLCHPMRNSKPECDPDS